MARNAVQFQKGLSDLEAVKGSPAEAAAVRTGTRGPQCVGSGTVQRVRAEMTAEASN
jgi:hypothetical protein